MHDRDALMAAIVAEPDADAPRLVYADWLEENPRHDADTARAHFIRLEIEAETRPSDAAELERQAAILFNKHHETWNADIPTWNEWYDSTLMYRRGFPYELRTVFRKLAHCGGKLFELIPIQSLSLRSGRHSSIGTPRLIECAIGKEPDLRIIRKLRVAANVHFAIDATNMEYIQLLTEFPTLTCVESLTLSGNGLHDDCVLPFSQLIERSPYHSTLCEVDLSENRITDAGAAALLASSSFDRLQRLILTGNPIPAESQRWLLNRFGNRVVM